MLAPINIIFIVCLIYFLLLLVLTYYAKRIQQTGSYSEFYLANRNLSTLILCFTLFASQYSGNTLLGMPAATYRLGFEFFVCIIFPVSVIGAYLLFAPKLQTLSQRYNFITPADYIDHQFQSRLLVNLVNLIYCIVLVSYIITNLKVIGFVVSNLTQNKITFIQAIIGLTFILLIYETIGGMRAVVWTDALQGLMMLIGCILIFYFIQKEYGSVLSHLPSIRQQRPDFFAAPDFNSSLKWFSMILLAAFSVSLYPHAIQRIFAAKSAKALKNAFKIMLLLSFIVLVPVVLIGLTGVSLIPGLDKSASEEIIPLLLTDLAEKSPYLNWLIIVFFISLIAAIMSTIDSVILSLSSIVNRDFLKRKSQQIGKGRYI